ncbi:hypothetical protein E2562_038637, partial [Oryza meyeriana var. granulata]
VHCHKLRLELTELVLALILRGAVGTLSSSFRPQIPLPLPWGRQQQRVMGARVLVKAMLRPIVGDAPTFNSASHIATAKGAWFKVYVGKEREAGCLQRCPAANGEWPLAHHRWKRSFW